MGFSSSGGAKVGTIELYGGNTAPDGWLLCNGGTISRTLYADLFAVIGTTYGAGDGNTTFKLPNGTNVVTSVNTNVPVKGSGMTLGLTNGSATAGLGVDYSADGYYTSLDVEPNDYGKNVATSGNQDSGKGTWRTSIVGVTTDASKSGIVGTVTRSIMNCKYIIKY